MRVEINSVWNVKDVDGVNDGVYRVLQHLPSVESIAIFQLTNRKSLNKPILISLNVFLDAVSQKNCSPCDFETPFYQLQAEEDIPPTQRKKRDEKWRLIKELVERNDYLINIVLTEKSRDLPSYAKQKGIYIQKLYRVLNLYWHFGQNKNALIPAYKLSGAKGSSRVAGTAKRGAPTKEYIPGLSSTFGKNVTECDKKLFTKAMKKYGFIGKEIALTRVYNQMLKEFYADEIILAEAQNRPAELPSLRSFSYWIKKLFSIYEVERKQTNKGYFERNKRGLRGSATEHVETVGSYFEIDATVIDVHIVSEFNRNMVLGRPTLYFVIDKDSRMIVGIHVSLEYASWRAGRQALVNSFTSKKDYCARFGINIEEADWPCNHIPQRLLCDRGEFVCKKPEELAVPLIGHVSIAPPYRADLKGIVERRFGLLNSRLLHELKGTTNGRHYVRGDKDPRLDAQFTVTEITRLIIDEVLEHNSSLFQDLARQSSLFIESGLPPTPINYWNVHLDNHRHALSILDESGVRASLLPKANVSMTSKGLRLNDNLYYECDHPSFEAWKSIARTNGRWTLEARIDQDNASFIFVRLEPNQKFTKCRITAGASNFENKHVADVLYFQGWLEREKKHATPSSRSIERHKRRKEIVDTANQHQKQIATSQSKSEKIQGIKKNRRKAIDKNRITSENQYSKPPTQAAETNSHISSQQFDKKNKIVDILKRTRGNKDAD